MLVSERSVISQSPCDAQLSFYPYATSWVMLALAAAAGECQSGECKSTSCSASHYSFIQIVVWGDPNTKYRLIKVVECRKEIAPKVRFLTVVRRK